MRINPIAYGIIVLAVFFGVILGFQAAGVWSVSGKVNSSGDAVQPSAADVETIKGWMTLEQVSTTYNVRLADLLAQFELPAGTPATTAIKDLESDVFSVTALRDWLLSRQNGSPVERTSIPSDMAASPKPDQVKPAETEPLTPTATVHAVPERTITGKPPSRNCWTGAYRKKRSKTLLVEICPQPPRS
jgi:hypothetical protein